MARRSLTLLLAAALAAGCVPAPAAAPTGDLQPGATRRPGVPVLPRLDAVAPLLSDKGLGLVAANGGSLIGKVKIPTGLIANNSSSLIANNGGGVIANNGGGLISDKGLGYQTLAIAEKPLVGFTVYIADAEGRAIPDPDGKPYTAVTDAEGGYRFEATPRGQHLVVRVLLPEEVGPMIAYMPDAAEGQARSVDVDGTSTLVMGYILNQLVKGDLAVLQKLPAEAEAETRRKAAAALGDELPLASFKPEALVALVESIRGADTAFDEQVEYVERLLVAGLADVGVGLEATKVSLTNPSRLARMADGSLLIAERNGHRVRRLKDGKITTFAGKDGAMALGDGGPATEAWIDRPSDVAVAPDGTVYIVDYGNKRLRAVDPRSGTITTILGNADGPKPATGLKASEVDADWVQSVAIDDAGRVAVASNRGTFLILPDGTLQDTGMPPVRRLAYSPGGELYGYNPDEAGAFYKFSGPGQLASSALPPVPASLSYGLTIGADGTIYLAADAQALKLVNGAWKPIAEAAALTLTAASEILPTPEGLVIADAASNQVWRLSASGAPTLIAGLAPEFKDGVAPDALSLNRPIDLAFDAQGRMYLADGWNGFIWQRRADGKYYRFAGKERANATTTDIGDGGPAREARFGNIGAFTLTSDGSMVVVDVPYPLARLRKIAPDGTVTSMTPPAGALSMPFMVAQEADGALLVSDYLSKKVVRLKDGQATDALPAGVAEQPAGLLPMPDGSFYLADLNGHVIYHVVEGVATVFAGGNGEGFSGDGGPAKDARLASPFRMVLDAAGDMVFSDSRNDRVRRIDMETGVIETIAGAGSANQAGSTPDDSLKEPIGLAFDRDGNLYITDSGHNQVKMVPKDRLGR
ncbi:MAG: hypothetical protein ACLGIN_06190 [Candidatus Sericytochromatia bacterium]